MMISIVLIFFICFLPYHTFMIWFHFFASTMKDYNKYWHIFRIIGFCMTFINSCINPLVLYFAITTFRERWELRRVKRSTRRLLLSDRKGSSVVREILNKPKAHHKPSLISLQEPWILQVFWVYIWYLNKSLGLLSVLKDCAESWYL